MRAARVTMLLVMILGSTRSTRADDAAPLFVLIVHPDNPADSVDSKFVSDAFLKKITRWSGGGVIKPVDLAPASSTRKSFSDKVHRRSVSAVRSYWQVQVFSGRDVPPPELSSDDDVVKFVLKHPGAIGYVTSGAKLGGVRVVALK